MPMGSISQKVAKSHTQKQYKNMMPEDAPRAVEPPCVLIKRDVYLKVMKVNSLIFPSIAIIATSPNKSSKMSLNNFIHGLGDE